MQVNKSNENYYLSVDTLIVAADARRSSVKPCDWRSSTSKILLLRWLAQTSNLHKGKGYITVQTNCHAWTRGQIIASQQVTIHKLGTTGLTLLFKLPLVIPFLFWLYLPAKQHGVKSMDICDTKVDVTTFL